MALGFKLLTLFGCALVGLVLWTAIVHGPLAQNPNPPSFVGSQTCQSCHRPQYESWKSSQHSQAMQPAELPHVLGNFDDGKTTYAGVTSTFFRRDGKFWVRTDGSDGTLQDFEVKYTFGVFPLQQYLLELPGGRLQALSIAWDSRRKEDGGQRWFHLYPDEAITYQDELHWTGRHQNWNFMCADCHSTNVQKGYEAAANRFQTTWSEISVGCESCHGPGSRHASWANAGGVGRWMADLRRSGNGLTAQLNERRGVHWVSDPGTAIVRRSQPRTSSTEIDVCAPCHSRRQQIAEGYRAGAAFDDHYVPALITPGLYHPDGQQRDEVYTYGSFLQSRMAQAGVTCADCHEPHTQKLRTPGNALCGQCHAPQKYDARAHHFHEPASTGAQCVSCHMPAATFMAIDSRRDHSIRVPRPDRSVTMGVPNACSSCHADRGAEWAARQVRTWYSRDAGGFQTFAEPFHADDTGRAAADQLARLAADSTQPPIIRASALARLGQQPGRAALGAARAQVGDSHSIVRHAALTLFEAFSAQDRLQPVLPLLRDPRRAVRLQAAWLLVPLADAFGKGADGDAFRAAAAEFIDSRRYRADRPEERMTLGLFLEQLGRREEAMEEYRSAVRLWPAFAPAHHTLGLALVRQGSASDALIELQKAAALAHDGDRARFNHDYAVALHSTGKVDDAIAVLKQAREQAPTNRDVLFALATFHRDAQRLTEALAYARLLQQFHPDDPDAAALVESLGPSRQR